MTTDAEIIRAEEDAERRKTKLKHVEDQSRVSHLTVAVVAQSNLAQMCKTPRFMKDHWADELRMISLGAAAAGDHKTALDGYETLGKHVGALSDGPAQQHLHIHDAELVREATTQELDGSLQTIRDRKAALTAQISPPTPDDVPPASAPREVEAEVVDPEIEDLL